jgi:dethiobiotin synthetase
MSPLLIVTGTGTGIGKTTIARALVRAWSRRVASVAGLKPIESGGDGDARSLGQVSTFHVTRFTPPYLLMDPVSPHLAARREGVTLSLPNVVAWTNTIRMAADAVVLELPGGLFTPLTDDETNADLVSLLEPSRVLLVAPDRLGVLHDVSATTRAASAMTVTIDGIVLSAPETGDASTMTNGAELARVLPEPRVLASVPRGSDDLLIEHAAAILETLGF